MSLSKKERQLRLKISGIFYLLNERQRRILAAVEAKAYGRGGIQAVARVTGISRQTVYNGLDDLNRKIKNDGRVRKTGAGRKKATDKNPEIITVLEEILESNTRGDPEAPLKWTCKSVRNLGSSAKSVGKKRVKIPLTSDYRGHQGPSAYGQLPPLRPPLPPMFFGQYDLAAQALP